MSASLPIAGYRCNWGNDYWFSTVRPEPSGWPLSEVHPAALVMYDDAQTRIQELERAFNRQLMTERAEAAERTRQFTEKLASANAAVRHCSDTIRRMTAAAGRQEQRILTFNQAAEDQSKSKETWERKAMELVQQAYSAGFRLTISNVSLEPLAQGNVRLRVDVWPVLDRSKE